MENRHQKEEPLEDRLKRASFNPFKKPQKKATTVVRATNQTDRTEVVRKRKDKIVNLLK